MSELTPHTSTTEQTQVEKTNCQFSPLIDALAHAAIERFQLAHNQRGDKPVGLIVGNSDVDGRELYQLYLESFPTAELRQEHTCSCCQQFFNTWANLVVLTQDGRSESALFVANSEVPELYRPFVEQAYVKLLDAKITRVTYGSADGWLNIGERSKGEFEHFHFELPWVRRQRLQTLTSRQEAAEVREDVRILSRTLSRWPAPLLRTAVGVLENDTRIKGQALADTISTFIDVLANLSPLRDQRLKHNYLVSVALDKGKGVSRIGNTVLGEFLDRLGENPDTHHAAVSHLITLLDPKTYLRPQAAPNAQNIAKAEEVVGKLGLQHSLRRRALRRDELTQFVWQRPQTPAVEASEGGVFADVQARGDAPAAGLPHVDGGQISFLSFITRKLPQAKKLEVYIPGSSQLFGSLLTAADETAPPILKWDRPEARWPISSYRYLNAVHASTWGLQPHAWEEVLAVIPGDPTAYRLGGDPIQSEFVMVNGRDMCSEVALPLFPETLIPDLYPHRAVIEAYCKKARLEDHEHGLVFFSAYQTGQRIRITTDEAIVSYVIGARE